MGTGWGRTPARHCLQALELETELPAPCARSFGVAWGLSTNPRCPEGKKGDVSAPKLRAQRLGSPRREGPAVPGEGEQRQDTQQHLRGVEEEEDGAEDGFQAQGVGLQQQVIRGHHSRGPSQGQADGEQHLALAQVALGACKDVWLSGG